MKRVDFLFDKSLLIRYWQENRQQENFLELSQFFSEHHPLLKAFIHSAIALKTFYKPDHGYIYHLHGEVLPGCVYNFHKLGMTRNSDRRIGQLDILTPFKVKKQNLWKSTHKKISEQLLHTMFFEKRLNGEWFDLNEDDIKKLNSIGTRDKLCYPFPFYIHRLQYIWRSTGSNPKDLRLMPELKGMRKTPDGDLVFCFGCTAWYWAEKIDSALDDAMSWYGT